jgi:nitrate reductase gamma subunit
MATLLDQFLFIVLPYIVLVLFFGVQAYRWTVNRFEWSAKSTEILEKQVIGVASIPFHYALIFLLAAHVLGVLSASIYTATLLSTFNILATIAGSVLVCAIAIAFARRTISNKARAVSGTEDYLILLFLIAIPTIGLYQIHVAGIFGLMPGVAAWIQSVFAANPQIEFMAALPLLNKIHISLAMIFLCYWPFTKLVHVATYPITYLYRRYQTMRRHKMIFQ